MELTQQLTQHGDGSGELVITADQASIGDLISLLEELKQRPGITTNGGVMELPPMAEPPSL